MPNRVPTCVPTGREMVGVPPSWRPRSWAFRPKSPTSQPPWPPTPVRHPGRPAARLKRASPAALPPSAPRTRPAPEGLGRRAGQPPRAPWPPLGAGRPVRHLPASADPATRASAPKRLTLGPLRRDAPTPRSGLVVFPQTPGPPCRPALPFFSRERARSSRRAEGPGHPSSARGRPSRPRRAPARAPARRPSSAWGARREVGWW